MALAFFESLPADELTDEEEELVRMLCEIAEFKNSFIPSDVSIQAWAEKRLPKDRVSLCNSSSLIFVKQSFKQKDGPEAPWKKQAVRQEPRHTGREFIASASLVPCPPPPPATSKSLQQPVQSSACPKEVKGVKVPPLFVKNAQVYFSERPSTAEEDALVDELVKILAGSSGLPIQRLMYNPLFLAHFHSVFPQGIEVLDWIQYRLADEVELKYQDFKLSGSKQKRKLEEDGTEGFRRKCIVSLKDGGTIKDSRTKEEWTDFRNEIQEAWLAMLPEDGFTTQEHDLRNGILEYLGNCPTRAATLSDVCTYAPAKKGKIELLPIYVSIKLWIERRIGGEIDTYEISPGEIGLSLK